VSIPILSLVGFAAWTLTLLLLLGGRRALQVVTGSKKPNQFSATPTTTDFEGRLQRAHLNCTENLPVFGALVLSGVALGVHATWFDALCATVLIARLGQSTAHLSSGRNLVINIRFSFFFVQLLAMLSLAAMLGSIAALGVTK
jgi:uncharacterized MAPEG superfamily protein